MKTGMSMRRMWVRLGVACGAAVLLHAADALSVRAAQTAEDGHASPTAQGKEGAGFVSQRDREAREREEEKAEAQQDRAEHLQELYDDGREALDEDRFHEAEDKFDALAQMNGPQTDAALYWKAYAQNRQGKKDAALATIDDLKKRYPQSKWKKDGEALEIEVRSSTGSKANPEAQSDQELKLLALQGLMHSNPEKAMPMVEKILNGNGSPKEKSNALFVLAQSGSPESRELLAKIARGQSNPDLQRKAIEYLAIFGGKNASKSLAEIYAGTTDAGVKQAVLKSYIITGDREQLAALAKSEPHPELRKVAIRNLGIVGGVGELQGLYAKETDRGVKQEILEAYFIGGNASGLINVAKTEKDPELRKKAVEKLSLMGSKEAQDYLLELLQK